jgi:hypothetical protein
VTVLENARLDLGLTITALWLDYFALGGRMDVDQLGTYLVEDGRPSSDADHDAIVHALNEAYGDAGSTADRLPYRAA